MFRKLIYVVVAVTLMVGGYGASTPSVETPGQTPGSYEEGLRFVVMGDSRSAFDEGYKQGIDDGTNPEVIKKILNKVKELNPQPEFAVLLGDLIVGSSPTRVYEEFKQQFSSFKSHITSVYPIDFFYPIVGNHDCKNTEQGEKAFSEAFPEFKANFYNGYDVNGVSKRSIYYFDRGDTRFFVLNSHIPGENHLITGKQYEWLKTNIDPTKKRNLFFVHEPAFATWKPGNSLDMNPFERNKLWSLIDNSNRPMVFTAHEHLYTRRHINSDFNATVKDTTFKFNKNIYQVTTGGFGGPINTECRDFKNVDVPSIGKFHFVVVDILKDRIHVKAIDINGKVLDEFDQR